MKVTPRPVAPIHGGLNTVLVFRRFFRSPTTSPGGAIRWARPSACAQAFRPMSAVVLALQLGIRFSTLRISPRPMTIMVRGTSGSTGLRTFQLLACGEEVTPSVYLRRLPSPVADHIFSLPRSCIDNNFSAVRKLA